jgi:hypothetical protein
MLTSQMTVDEEEAVQKELEQLQAEALGSAVSHLMSKPLIAFAQTPLSRYTSLHLPSQSSSRRCLQQVMFFNSFLAPVLKVTIQNRLGKRRPKRTSNEWRYPHEQGVDLQNCIFRHAHRDIRLI